MTEWRECKLNDLLISKSADLQTGPFGTMLNSSEYEINGTPVIAVQDIGENKLNYNKLVFVNQKTAERLSKYKVLKNDIIFSRKGAVERRALIRIHEEGWLQGSDCIRLRLHREIDPIFASYQIGSKKLREWILQNAGGATMPSLNQSILKELPIRYPSYPEQRAIAAVLSSLDNKIDLLHRQNKTLEQMAETLFRQWFVEEASEDWEEGALGDLVEVKYGKDHKKLIDGTIPVYGSGGYMRAVDRSLFEGESVLIPRKGTLNNVLYVDEAFWTVDTMFYTIMKKAQIAKFIYQFIMLKDLASMNVGSAVPSMTTAVLNNMAITIPPDDLLKKFDELVSGFYSKINSNQTQIRTLEKLRDTMLPKLMSGEVRVKN